MRTKLRLSYAAITAVALLLAVDLRLRPGGLHDTRAIDDILQAVAAGAAGVASLVRARGLGSRRRLSWLLVGAGCLAWSGGELVWSFYELVLGREVPFPSFADVGFLALPALALPGLLLRPGAPVHGAGRLRLFLDGLIIAASLFTLSWVTALGHVYVNGEDSRLSLAVALAYPTCDVVMLTAVVLSLTIRRFQRPTALLAAALMCLAFADSAFVYLTATNAYATGNLIDVAWVIAFLLVVPAAISDVGEQKRRDLVLPSRWMHLLPYAPAVVAVVTAAYAVRGHHKNDLAVAGAAAVVIGVIVRQFLVVRENHRLLREVVEQREQLHRQAFYDQLTGLANRALFQDRLEHALDLHERNLRTVSVLLLDLDEFKLVNDSLGHPAGDELLVRVAERLRAVTRTGDTVARLGGDEFAILIEDDGHVMSAGQRVIDSLGTAVPLGGRDVLVSASVGAAVLTADDRTVSGAELLKRADVAMYSAKRRGKKQLALFTPDLYDATVTELDLRGALVQALANDGLQVAYQPICTPGGIVVGFEALARWTHQGHDVTPAQFLPVAERIGLLADLDLTMLRKAARACALWQHDRSGTWVSVNASGAFLALPRLRGLVETALRGAGLPPELLVLELLEDTALDEQALRNLEELRALGVRLAIDDFGVGHSALSRLLHVSPHIIKIDRSLVNDLAASPVAGRLLAGVVELARSLRTSVIAEGVETAFQMEQLEALHVDAVQGFLIGRPSIRTAIEPATTSGS